MTKGPDHEGALAMQPQSPLVGVGAIILRRRTVLLGMRIGSHGAGTWALPGGHLELGETVEACARREVLEESGLELGAIANGPYTSNIFPDVEKHYVTLFVIARSESGEPKRLEPTKCAEWRWFAWDDLPQPLFAPLESLRRTGFDPF